MQYFFVFAIERGSHFVVVGVFLMLVSVPAAACWVSKLHVVGVCCLAASSPTRGFKSDTSWYLSLISLIHMVKLFLGVISQFSIAMK